MNEYTRAAFLEWLETLPADAPFCRTFCPIATWRGHGLVAAQCVDPELTHAIDQSLIASGMGSPDHGLTYGNWSEVTPREVIAIIDELEAA